MLDSEISTHTSSEDGISLEDKSSSQDKDSSLMSRKISVAFSETDSGVDVGGSEEESLDTGVEKKVIRPDHEIISRLCNFDEEEEDELSDDDDDEDSLHSDHDDTVTLTLRELGHIMTALVHDYVETRLAEAEEMLTGRRCAVCACAISLMFLHTGTRCELCSFVACSHCSHQVEHVTPEQRVCVGADLLTPASVEIAARHQSRQFSSLSVPSLMAHHHQRSRPASVSLAGPGLQWLASKVRRWSRPDTSLLCSTCCRVVSQAVSADPEK